jgi:hypothetical protein
MKNIKIFSLLLVLILGAASCELPDNVDPKSPSLVPAATLVTNAEVELFNQIDSKSVNTNITSFFVQYFTETTYFDEARYNMTDRNIPYGYWVNIYRDVLSDLKEARTLVDAVDAQSASAQAVKDNQLAIITVLEVYAWQVLVDGFGNIPYSEALLGGENFKPTYDDASGIYSDLITRLGAAVNSITVSEGSFGAGELVFNGDMGMWSKFGASLMLRLGMRLADVDASLSQSTVAAALTAGVFNTAGESASLNYPGVTPHVGFFYNHFEIDGRADYLPTSQIVDYMVALNDPRLEYWYTQYGGSYVGATYGLDGAQSYNNYSNFSPVFLDAQFPAVLMDYAEVEFLLAEAAERNYAVGGTAAEHFDNAVTESINSWYNINTELGYTVTTPDVATYLSTVDYATLRATQSWQQVIGEQKWLGLYNRGVEAWAEWRRLDYPVLPAPEGLTAADMPVRYFYPIRESQLNKSNVEAAGSAIGGDAISTKLFWDVY